MSRMRVMKAVGLIVFFSLTIAAHAQSLKQYLSYGDEAMRKGEYYNAAQYYKKGLERFEFNLELKYKYAEALRGFNDYKNASEVYKKIAEEDVTKEYPLASFWYGLMLHYQGNYKIAIPQFKKFVARYKKSDYYHDKAQQEIASCSWALDHLKDSLRINIHVLPDSVNTVYAESNPFERPDGHFLFSSLRSIDDSKKKDKYLARIYADTSTMPFSPAIPDQSKHMANGCYSSDQKRFYFTLCGAIEENISKLRCDIYEAQVSGDKFSEIKKLDNNINDPGYTNTQPNIGKDESGKETLYFVSDRPGGMGKTDVWSSRINNDGSYQEPVNAGKEINSIDEEFSPFYDNIDHKLYFASNWHYSYGGLDLFESTLINGTWSAPKNMGRAINSPQNDFYFYKSMDRSKNYLASNRLGSHYIKSETCCNDIWMYETGKKIEKPKVDTIAKIVAETKIDTPVRIPVTIAEVKKEIPAEVKTPVAKIDTPQHVWIYRTATGTKQMVHLTLYFHNDEPECCNLRDTTALNYVETYENYWKLYGEYKQEYAKGMNAADKKNAEQQVSELFTGKVEKGYHDLIQFSTQLYDILRSGQKLEVTVQGYCSPLNYSEYNIKLGYRRVASLRNYFYHYRGGALMEYIASGKLILKNQSFGEDQSNKTVSDKLEDTRNSVYSPAAALERKVEIISVEVK